MIRPPEIACFVMLLLSPLVSLGQKAKVSPLHLDQVIDLPGVQGGLDHFAFDKAKRRLYLAAEDQGTVETIDLNGRQVHSISGFTNPHSILVRPWHQDILVTDSGENASALIDSHKMTVTRKLHLALGANCILYDQEKNRVYVTAGGDRVHQTDSTLQSIDADSGRVIASVIVSALHLQPMALDAATDRLFVNVADQDAIAIYDRNTLGRVGTWKLPAGHKNSPIAFDAEYHRLFVIAADPGILMQFNSDTGALEASIPTPADPDDMSFDRATQRIYVPGDRFLAAFDVSSRTSIRLIQREETDAGARTGMLLDSGAMFVVAVPPVGSKPARVLVFTVAEQHRR